MSLLFGCGEDSGLVVNSTGRTTSSATYKRNTSRVAYSIVGGQSIHAYLPSTVTTCWARFVASRSQYDSTGYYFWHGYNDSGVAVVRFSWNTVQVWNGSSWVSLSGTLPLINWTNYSIVTIKVTCGTSGSVVVWYDDVEVYNQSFSQVNTNNLKSWNFRNSNGNTSTTYEWWYSEFSFSTQSLVGGVCETEAPNANGTDSTDGTGSYTDIDETYVGTTTDAVVLDTAAQKRSFAFPARDQGLSSVKGVVVSAAMSREETGPQNARFYIIVGGTRYYSPSIALTLSVDRYSYVWEDNPSTGLPWTKAQAEAGSIEGGVEALA